MNSQMVAEVAVAVITAGGGYLAAIRAIRRERTTAALTSQQSATDFGRTLASAAFESMQAQVDDLVEQIKANTEERKILTQRIEQLTTRIDLTNSYLQHVLLVLDQHSITRPPPPLGFL